MAGKRIVGGTAQLIAVSNGTTLSCVVGVINGPLRQEYRKGTDICMPDWENSADKPIIYIKINQTDNGAVVVPVLLDLCYNGVPIAFDASGISTTGTMAGVFKKSIRSINIDGRDYPNMITFEVMKNLVPISSFDNDMITLKGAVEIRGKRIDFDSVNRMVEILETVGQSIVLYLEGDTDITTQSPKATINSHVQIDGTPPADMTAFLLKWHDVKGDLKTLINTGATSIEILASQVDGSKTILCELFKKSTSELLSSAFINVNDYTDPYRIFLYLDGVKGEEINPGETAVYTAKVEKSDNTIVNNAVTHFTTRDPKGNLVESMSGTRSSVSATYDEVEAVGGGIFLYASATVDIT